LQQFALKELFGLGLGGHVEKCALAVAFDRVAYATGRFSLLRPRRPASGGRVQLSGCHETLSASASRGRRRGLSHARRARSVPAPTECVEIQRGASTDPARAASEHPTG